MSQPFDSDLAKDILAEELNLACPGVSTDIAQLLDPLKNVVSGHLDKTNSQLEAEMYAVIYSEKPNLLVTDVRGAAGEREMLVKFHIHRAVKRIRKAYGQ